MNFIGRPPRDSRARFLAGLRLGNAVRAGTELIIGGRRCYIAQRYRPCCLLPPLLQAATPWPLSARAILKVWLGVALVTGIDLDPDIGAENLAPRHRGRVRKGRPA